MRDFGRADNLLASVRDRNPQLRVLPLDVTDRGSINKAVQTIVAETGGIYGVINNAGVGLRGYFEDLAAEEMRQVFEANVFGVTAVTKAVLPHMREAGRGRIIFISPVGGRIGSSGLARIALPSLPWRASVNHFFKSSLRWA
jgi:NAD(P)-dependent dehydrogenase (short-subunit alcohol dehydrogenase family)